MTDTAVLERPIEMSIPQERNSYRRIDSIAERSFGTYADNNLLARQNLENYKKNEYSQKERDAFVMSALKKLKCGHIDLEKNLGETSYGHNPRALNILSFIQAHAQKHKINETIESLSTTALRGGLKAELAKLVQKERIKNWEKMEQIRLYQERQKKRIYQEQQIYREQAELQKDQELAMLLRDIKVAS